MRHTQHWFSTGDTGVECFVRYPEASQRLPREACSKKAATQHAVSLQHGCSTVRALFLAAAEHAEFYPAHA